MKNQQLTFIFRLLMVFIISSFLYFIFIYIPNLNNRIEDAKLANAATVASANQMINDNRKSFIENEIYFIFSATDDWLMKSSIDGSYTNLTTKEIFPFLRYMKNNGNDELISMVESIKYTITINQDEPEHFILKIYGLKSLIGSEDYIRNSQIIKATKITSMNDHLELDFSNKTVIELVKFHNKRISMENELDCKNGTIWNQRYGRCE